MLKLKFILTPIMLFSWSLCAQTRNYDQELCNLLYGKQMESAQHFYSKYQDSIFHPFTVDSYRLISNIYAGKPDSVFSQLPAFMDKYYGNAVDDNLLLFLPTFYWDRDEYESGLEMLTRIETFFNKQQNEKQGNEKRSKELEKLKNRYEAMNRFPKPEIKISDSVNAISVPIQTEPMILFEAKYNQTVLKTVFDTGVSCPFFTQKKNVEKAGIKMIEPYSENVINGKETSSAYGIIDSVRIGGLLIKNMPILVVEENYFTHCIPDSVLNRKDKLSEIDSIANSMEIVMGLPVIKMLSHIQFDLQDNNMTILFNHEMDPKENGNMYIESDRLYLRSRINGMDFTAVLDTGGNLGDRALIVSNRFYRDHKEQLSPIVSETKETQNLCWIGGADHFDFLKPSSLNLQLGDCFVEFANETAILTDDSLFSLLSGDGFIGFGLLKKMKKMIFDFKSMQIACE